jgi:hypothetical protein
VAYKNESIELDMKCCRTQLVLLFSFAIFSACEKETPVPGICANNNFEIEKFSPRSFKMGFTTWPYGPELPDVESTYAFIESNSDIYSEQVDAQIPWKSWINNTPLPQAFNDVLQFKLNARLKGHPLLLSISLLGNNRNELSEDFDGTIPAYQSFNDTHIREAYLKHVKYLVDKFSPDYLVFAMEVNELHLNAPSKWEGYKLMADYVRSQLKASYPSLRVAESFTLHGWFGAHLAGQNGHVQELRTMAAVSDFTAISFYAFMKGLKTQSEFQQAFDFLHAQAQKPIAFVETNHLAEDLSVEKFNVFLKGDQCEQNLYLETLLQNAQANGYEFIIWWAHRDYDAIWETLPANVKDLGKFWRDTGLLDETGKERKAYQTWKSVLNK